MVGREPDDSYSNKNKRDGYAFLALKDIELKINCNKYLQITDPKLSKICLSVWCIKIPCSTLNLPIYHYFYSQMHVVCAVWIHCIFICSLWETLYPILHKFVCTWYSVKRFWIWYSAGVKSYMYWLFCDLLKNLNTCIIIVVEWKCSKLWKS